MAAQPGWFRFLSTYYVANTVVLLSYFVARWHFLNHGPHGTYSRLDSRDDLISKERSTFPLLLLALAVKFWRQQSLDGFLSDLFFYGKACIGVLTFYQDVRAPAVLLLAWLLLFLLVPQPLYKGPSSIENFTPASFKNTVLDRPDSGTDWLVELFAPWAPPCIHLEPVLAKLSLAYTAEHLRFGRIDVSKWPAMAAQLNVNLSGVAQQLPTLLLFEKGKEAARIPHVYEDGSVAKGRFRKADIITGFELERRFHKRAGQPEGSSTSRTTTARRRR